MNLLTLKYFCDTARLESITKAAEANYISQTAMSQQIAKLERELGIKLFTRDKGRVRINSAGRSFYNDCVRILDIYSAAVNKARNAVGGSIRVGILTSTTVDYFEVILDRFAQIHKDAAVHLIQHSFSSMRLAIENGSLDAMICPLYNAGDLRDVRYVPLLKEKLGLLVPLSDPISAKDSVYVKDIRHQKIIMTDESYAGPSYGQMLNAKARVGYVPDIVEEVSSAEMLVLMVALGRGSAFLPEDRAVYDHKRCKMLHIIDGDDISETGLAWSVQAESPLLNDFIQTVSDFFEKDYPDWIRNYKKQNL